MDSMAYAIQAQVQAQQQQAQQQYLEQQRRFDQQTADYQQRMDAQAAQQNQYRADAEQRHSKYLADQTAANRPNQVTPWGTSTWTNNNGQWENNVTLNPQDQARLDQQRTLASQLQGLTGQSYNNVANQVNNPLSFDPSFQRDSWTNVGDTSQQQASDAYGRMMQLMDPQIANDRRQYEDMLANQGLSRDSSQYQAGYRNLEDSIARMRLNAQNQAMGEGRQQGQYDMTRATTNQQGFQNAGNYNMNQQLKGLQGQLGVRQGELNTLAALNGNAVQAPTFNGFSTAGQQTATTDQAPGIAQTNLATQPNLNSISQWGWGQGNQFMQQQNQEKQGSGIMGQLGGLAGTAIGTYFGGPLGGAAMGGLMSKFGGGAGAGQGAVDGRQMFSDWGTGNGGSW